MIVTKTDGNVVGETASAAFSVQQNGGLNLSLILKNSGVNVITYETQFWNVNTWLDAGTLGSAYWSTLQAGQTITFQAVSTTSGLMQVLANASGGSYLDFSVTFFQNRLSGTAV